MDRKEKRETTMKKRIEIIKEFARQMGYETYEDDYMNYMNNRPCYCIELVGTSDSEGNSYAWAWYTDTYEELFF